MMDLFFVSFGSEGSSEGQFNQPDSGVVGRDGNIVVSDSLNHRIQVMDIEGNFIRCFWNKRFKMILNSNCPQGVDVDGEGRIVVCEGGNRRVSVFEKDGTFLFSFGPPHMRDPSGVVVDSFGSIIISDWWKKSIGL